MWELDRSDPAWYSKYFLLFYLRSLSHKGFLYFIQSSFFHAAIMTNTVSPKIFIFSSQSYSMLIIWILLCQWYSLDIFQDSIWWHQHIPGIFVSILLLSFLHLFQGHCSYCFFLQLKAIMFCRCFLCSYYLSHHSRDWLLESVLNPSHTCPLINLHGSAHITVPLTGLSISNGFFLCSLSFSPLCSPPFPSRTLPHPSAAFS